MRSLFCGRDKRHDHSFRIPRPDLSVKLGTPNSCNDCHADKSPEWAAASIEGWHGTTQKRGSRNTPRPFNPPGPKRRTRRRSSLSWRRMADAPAIARATALRELGSRAPRHRPSPLARRGLAERDPMVRVGAMDMLSHTCPPPSRSGRLSRRSSPSRARGAHAGPRSLLAAVPTTGVDVLGRPRAASSVRRPNSLPRASSMPNGPEERADAGQLSMRAAVSPVEAENGVQGSAAPEPAICAGGSQCRRSLPPARPRRRGRKRVACHDRPVAAGCPDCITRSALLLTPLKTAQTDALDAFFAARPNSRPDRVRYAYVYAVALHFLPAAPMKR